eukprot:6285571-Amphidinium_carterae.1
MAGRVRLLFRFILKSNQLLGALPGELACNRNVHEIELSANAFEGAIPDGSFPDSVHLLTASKNKLSGMLPMAFYNMHFIQECEMSKNMLAGPIPIWIGRLTSLRLLGVCVNRFSGTVPEGLAQFDSGWVLELALNNNRLSGSLPDWLGKISGVGYLS